MPLNMFIDNEALTIPLKMMFIDNEALYHTFENDVH